MRSLQQRNHHRLLFVIGAMCSIRGLPIISIRALLARPALQQTLPTCDSLPLNCWSACSPTQDNESRPNGHGERDQSMSALGQKQTYALQKAMSALHPIATAEAYFRTRSCPLYPRKRTCACRVAPRSSLSVSAIGIGAAIPRNANPLKIWNSVFRKKVRFSFCSPLARSRVRADRNKIMPPAK
jgi:hypothetical protein